ncbi:large ribosomal subunit protein mL48 [Echeneis naucrates]|uniref:Large ribosomal subunit protein mL48 n=1 Tax=Echeneis naucrates TaxID=173247 RepID=A0A665VGU5_ECHNA|nr:39S ribosomal protein L48, mitochondrial [Echeneis naucrates]
MSSAFRRLQVCVLNPVLALCRATPSVQSPVCDMASVNDRQYHSMPTHGIGKWSYLVKRKGPKKKKDRFQMKPVVAASDTAYGTLNVKVSGYDMTLVEHYAQYIHNFCNRLDIKVGLCYALPTKTTEVMLMQEQGTKMYVDAVLKTHERVIQLTSLKSTLCPVFMDVLLKNQPEGVQLSVKEHTEADYKMRFKARPALEELLAQMNH